MIMKTKEAIQKVDEAIMVLWKEARTRYSVWIIIFTPISMYFFINANGEFGKLFLATLSAIIVVLAIIGLSFIYYYVNKYKRHRKDINN